MLPHPPYEQRQQRAQELLNGGALLLLSQPTAYRNSTVEHSYRQDSFLQYLCGFEEPDSALLILTHPDAPKKKILFLRPKDAHAELWEGRRLGPQEALKNLPIDEALPISDLWEKLPQLLGESTSLHFRFGNSPEADRRIIQVLAAHRRQRGRQRSSMLPVFDPTAVSGQLRLCKDPSEVARMRRAATITHETFQKIYATTRPGMNEKEVYGLIMGEFLTRGGDMESYGSIIAGGENACILHYRDNNQPLRDGTLLLIDAGAQFQYYASDVTRTFPVGRKFSGPQRALYEIVLAAQKNAINKAQIGSNLVAVHEAAMDTLITGLRDLKLLTGTPEEIKEKKLLQRFYPHNTSHWIGMDVHDVGEYVIGGKPLSFVPGMYFSVEPGIYVDPADHQAPEEYRGIGIRIEDDVLITDGGPDVLTGGIAKEVRELEDRG